MSSFSRLSLALALTLVGTVAVVSAGTALRGAGSDNGADSGVVSASRSAGGAAGRSTVRSTVGASGKSPKHDVSQATFPSGGAEPPQRVTISRTLRRDQQYVLRVQAERDARQAARVARRAERVARQTARDARAAEKAARRVAGRVAEKAAEKTPVQAARRKVKRPRGAPFKFDIATFNALGSQHTGRNGSHRRYAAGRTRARWTARIMAGHGTDIIGLQELQDDQLKTLLSATGGAYAAYPGTELGAAETDNSILWRKGTFKRVSAKTRTITFMSRPRPQAIVRLRHKATGSEFYVTNWHPSAGHDRLHTRERRAGWKAQVATVNRLKATGLPVFVTGDMNDRAAYICAVSPPTGLRSANGGRGCNAGRITPVDWIMGLGGVGFRNYVRDGSALVSRTSDHFYVSATARVK